MSQAKDTVGQTRPQVPEAGNRIPVNGSDPAVTAMPKPQPSYGIIDELRANVTIRESKPRKWRFWN